MQEGAGRGGRGHGARQPDMGRELGALGERAEGHQQQHHRVDSAAAQRVAAVEDLDKAGVAGDIGDHQQPRQQGDAAAAGEEKRLERALAGCFVLGLVGNQQERGDAGALPEDEQADDIAGHDQAQHGSHEQQQVGQEAPGRLVPLEVVAGVDDHQRADAGYEQRKQRAEAVVVEIPDAARRPATTRSSRPAADRPASSARGKAAGQRRSAAPTPAASSAGSATDGRSAAAGQTAPPQQSWPAGSTGEQGEVALFMMAEQEGLASTQDRPNFNTV